MYTELFCPVCRSSIVGRSYDDLGVKSNFSMRSLLEIIERFPNHEHFLELYRVHQELTLDLTRILAISENNHSQHLLTYNHELRTRVFLLQRQLQTAEHVLHSKDKRLKEVRTMLESLTRTNEQLKERVTEQDKIISNLQDALEKQEKRFNEMVLVVKEHIRSLEAQRNEFNVKKRMVLQKIAQEQGSNVGEVMKPMGKKKVLVKAESLSTRM